ncbi:PQ-loop repeat-containing protein [Rhodotorula paludigena]|uniref:PQ-loop repeat-containing protein n=1 Tax=Rhodotorula paludigena TaxID=86838 RepID=UPI00316F5E6F
MDSSPAPGPLDALVLLHARPIASPSTCRANYVHDPVGMALSGAIVVGLLLSYLPAFVRIVRHRNSAGYSPLFLLLGATSSASSLGNIVTLQWGQVACCQYLSAGQCFESVLGIAQVFVQWSCFLTLFFLYLVFYPLSSKYVQSVPISDTDLPSSHRNKRGVLSSLVPNFMRTTTPAGLIRDSLTDDDDDDDTDVSDADTTDGGLPGGRRGGFDPRRYILPGQLRRGEIILSSEYRHAVSLLLLTLLHLALTFLTTLILLITLPKAETPHPGTPSAPWDPTYGGGSGSGAPQDGAGGGREHPSERAVRVWATTLGLVSVALGCAQYAPQLVHTARRKLVGSLSIPMMLLQTPGSFVFVYTLAIRPGVNFTGWATYFVTGVLQGTLLVLCLVFRRRQRRLGVDDWGNPLPEATRGEGEGADAGRGERRPLLG